MQKLLTISIAMYNMEKYIAECLDSLIRKEVLSYIEVLIISDGSNDSSDEIAKKYCSAYPQTFRLIQKENGGWGSTVNTGIKHANGKYFKLLDADDFFVTDNLERYLQFLSKNRADLIYTPYITYYDASKNKRLCDEIRSIGEGKECLFEKFVQEYSISMHSITVKTSLLKENNIELLQNCFYTDIQYVLEIYCRVHTISYLGVPIYCYRVGREGQSCSWSGYCRHHEDHKRVIEYCVALYESKVLPSPIYQAGKRRIAEMMAMQYYIYGKFPTKQRRKRMLEWDEEVKNKYIQYYEQIPRKEIRLYRKCNFRATFLINCFFEWYRKKRDALCEDK